MINFDLTISNFVQYNITNLTSGHIEKLDVDDDKVKYVRG